MGTHISTLLHACASTHAEAVAIAPETGASLTYQSLDAAVHSIAAHIAAIRPNASRQRARIGIVLPNGADLAVALLGTAIAAEAAPFNPACKASEFEAYFRATAIDALIVGAHDNGLAVTVAKKLGIRLVRLLSGYALDVTATATPAAPNPDDVALVLMTSGSTGRPKIVPLSHRNVCVSAQDVCRSMGLSPQDRCLSMWEQYHIGGLVDLLLAPLSSGGCVIATSGFDAANFFRILSVKRPTWFQGVPTTLNELLFHARRHALTPQPNSLRLVRSVAAALDPRLMQELEELFGVPVIQTFGMTEAGPLISSTHLSAAARKPRSVGRSCGPEIRIVAAEGETLPAGQSGEVAVRGDNVFSGYENDLAANAAQFRDGWFHTGDTGYLDADGDLFLTGRIKQLINRGGEKVSPQEVDDALLLHPAVAEAAAFAIKHRTLGEDVAAAVVLRTAATAEDIRSFLSTQLASFKLPSRLLVLDRLPRNPVGKIDRLALAEAAAAENEAASNKMAPRNDLELWLVLLWSKELGVTNVGVFDDFAALGGDSLSGLRILVAIESGLKISLPDDIFADFSTVASLAARLNEMGVKTPASRLADNAQPISENADDILKSIDVGAADADQAPNAMLQSLRVCANEIEFRIVADAATLYSTPAELKVAITQMRGKEIGSRTAKKLSIFERCRLRVLLWRWRRQLSRELEVSSSASRWARKKLADNVLLYTADDHCANKTLIVGFTGNYMRLMVPTYRVLSSLHPETTDLLILSDPARSCFFHGLSDVGNNLSAVAQFVKGIADRRGYRRVITLGTSGGGLAALYTAIVHEWPKAVAVGCASLDRHPDIAALLREVATAVVSESTELVLTLSCGNERDREAARQISAVFRHAQTAADARFKAHNLINELYLRGELPRFFSEIIS